MRALIICGLDAVRLPSFSVLTEAMIGQNTGGNLESGGGGGGDNNF